MDDDFKTYTGWEYEPSSITLDGKAFTAMLKVLLPGRSCWGLDLQKWERLIAIQVAAYNSWGPRSCQFVRKVVRVRRVDLAAVLAVPEQVIKDVEAGVREPSPEHTKYLTEKLQEVLDSMED